MTFVIAAAGTGGHVFPGLSVGQALQERGVAAEEILYVGGDRLEADVYPAGGFPFLQLELRGLKRSFAVGNLGIPSVVRRSRRMAMDAMADRRSRVVLGLGGYVTVPVGMAARASRLPFFNAEQNATAGLANRIAARWARRTFGSFPSTEGLPGAVWVGNPVRRPFWEFEREAIREQALARYRLNDDLPVLGVFGGSLGAGAINEAAVSLVTGWQGRPFQLVHLTGHRFAQVSTEVEAPAGVTWRSQAFEPDMEYFYAASDLVVSRAGGGVAELTATKTPSVLVPGDFGSGGHQAGNARFLSSAGASELLGESDLDRLSEIVGSLLFDRERLNSMRESAGRVARPRAALTIADALLEAVS